MTNHTPGPWAANPDGLIHAGKNRLHIAQAATIGMGHAAAANARLMAAAPDLLAACLMARENLSPAYSSDHMLIRMLNDAIKKSTGK